MGRSLKTFLLSFVTASFILAIPLLADTVILKNGNKVIGIVTEENEKSVTLQFDKTSTITFSRSEVDRFVYASEEEREVLRAEWEKKPKASPEVPSEVSSEVLPQIALPKLPRRIAKAPPLAPTRENRILLSEGEWKGRKSQHFVVYYQDLIQGRAVLDRAEYHLEKILGDLHIQKREYLGKKFTVFVVQEERQWHRFLEKLGAQTELTGGLTTGVQTREIFLYGLSIPYLQLAFPHELTHILLEEVAKGRKIPLWFGEGFANYEGGIIGIDEDLLMGAIQKKDYVPLSELVTNTSYPADVNRRKLFYTESEKLVEYLITQYGRSRFGEFTERLLESGDFEQALRSAYGGKIGGIEHLGSLWLQYLSE